MISSWMLYFVLSSSGWMIGDSMERGPSCAYLTMMNVVGIESADTYEITTDELCNSDANVVIINKDHL